MESEPTVRSAVSKLHLFTIGLTVLAVASTIGLVVVFAVALAPTHIDPVAFEFPAALSVFTLQPLVCPAALFIAALNRRFNPSRAANRALLACCFSAAVWLLAFLYLVS